MVFKAILRGFLRFFKILYIFILNKQSIKMDFNTENASSILINKIKQKPELNSVNDKFIQESLENYLKKRNLSLESLKNFREKEIKVIVKDIRAKLRLLTGQFS